MRISGVGCLVVDYIYHDVDFSRPEASQYLSNDGINGVLVGEGNLLQQLEEYFQRPKEVIIRDMTGGRTPEKALGGVSVVTLISAAQLLSDCEDIEVFYHANIPNNELGRFALETIQATPLCTEFLRIVPGESVVTYALCGVDLSGKPSRTFLCYPTVHPSTALHVDQLDDGFYDSELTVFSCIQWEPEISRCLSSVLKKSKETGSITIVTTASDPMMRGRKKWVLGDGDQAYQYIDILIMNHDEALNYSGTDDLDGAAGYFKSFPAIEGVLITNGRLPTYVYARGGLSLPWEGFVPTAGAIDRDKEQGILPVGDTVGCGDNFCGGVVASIARQLRERSGKIDLVEACIIGNLSGGITSTTIGGVFKERYSGEKRAVMNRYLADYRRQVAEPL